MILYEDVNQLRSLVANVRNSPHASFYEKHYGALPEAVATVEELPFLLRQHLVDVPADERCYVPKDQVAFMANTSGTTSREPLVSFFASVSNYHVDPTWGTDVSRILVVFPPLNKNFGGTFIQQCREGRRPVTPVFGDTANLPVSAYLGNLLNVDALYATPTLAFALAPHLAQKATHTKIKLLVISGETITDEQRISLQALYPNALLANLYASSEIGQFIMGPTLRMMEDGVPGFSLLTDALVAAELVDNELVITYAQNAAFPLIRYRTGDLFEVREDWTKTYGATTPVLAWLGKGGVDVVRVYGLEVRSGSVDAFFANLALKVSDYQVHLYAGAEAGVVRVEVEYLPLSDVLVDPTYIHDACLETFSLRSGESLRASIDAGFVESLHVKVVPALYWQGAKRRVLINHIV